MSSQEGINMRWPVVGLASALLLATGAGATYFVLRPPPASTPASGTSSAGSAPPESRQPPGGGPSEVIVTLSPDVVARAGITVATIGRGGQATSLRLPGVVEPNAYRQVAVTPLVTGRMTRVTAELGQRVRQGDVMAQVFSPELEEAHARYTSARADLEAHERELARTDKLVAIGAATRQELERLHAEHEARTADVSSARSKLELLGVPANALDALPGRELRASADIRAPIDGVVTERLANAGLNVEAASKLFTIVDLTTVWVVADLYERDFARVRVGSPATVTTAAYADLALEGRVSYIDPQVSAQARTAKLRVEVPNTGNQLRLGMYADVLVSGVAGAAVPAIPRAAVQTIGDRQVVYLADPKQPGKFTEREVRLGPAAGESVEVVSGVQPGDAIVSEGSFFVRAERERLGLGASVANAQAARVIVGAQGFDPAKVSVRAGSPAQITFVRTTDQTCATEVVFPSLNIRRALPLNQPVVIEFPQAKAGEIAFACGMGMFHGTVVVR